MAAAEGEGTVYKPLKCPARRETRSVSSPQLDFKTVERRTSPAHWDKHVILYCSPPKQKAISHKHSISNLSFKALRKTCYHNNCFLQSSFKHPQSSDVCGAAVSQSPEKPRLFLSERINNLSESRDIEGVCDGRMIERTSKMKWKVISLSYFVLHCHTTACRSSVRPSCWV